MFWKEFKELTMKKKFQMLGMAVFLTVFFFTMLYAAAIFQIINS
jgi:hypothetical protein